MDNACRRLILNERKRVDNPHAFLYTHSYPQSNDDYLYIPQTFPHYPQFKLKLSTLSTGFVQIDQIPNSNPGFALSANPAR